MQSRQKEFIYITVIATILAIAFLTAPSLDIVASSLFFQDGAWLLERDSAWLYPIYVCLPRLGQVLFFTIAALCALSIFERFGKIREKRGLLIFLLVGAIVGPVLVVDMGLKDHSGRARPINVRQFGGSKQFTPAFVPANQCQKNCSFVSGHVVGVSFLMAFGWLGTPLQRRRWLAGSLLAASVVGVARMLPGGHFLSDVMFSWIFVYFSLWLTEWALLRVKLK